MAVHLLEAVELPALLKQSGHLQFTSVDTRTVNVEDQTVEQVLDAIVARQPRYR